MNDYQVRSPLSRFVSAWLLTAVLDGLFSSLLSAFAYGSTVQRLWLGVASVLLGPDALKGGNGTAAIGLAMHFGVAFSWTAIFMFGLMRSGLVIRTLNSPLGVLKIAALYGPFIWLVMSLVVIPQFTHKPPAITYKWWIQVFGHIPFVALPIVAMVSRGSPSRRKPEPSLTERFGPNMNPDGTHIDPEGQINALLHNKAYHYVATRLGMTNTPSGAYDYVFTVRRKDIDAFVARNHIKPEDFAAEHHWLSLHHIGDKWIVRQFIPPEKAPGFDQDTPFDTYEEAQSVLLGMLLRNAQTGVRFE